MRLLVPRGWAGEAALAASSPQQLLLAGWSAIQLVKDAIAKKLLQANNPTFRIHFTPCYCRQPPPLQARLYWFPIGISDPTSGAVRLHCIALQPRRRAQPD